MNEASRPEIIFRVAEEFNEREYSAPGVWSVDDEALQEDLGRDFLESVRLDFGEQPEGQGTEPLGVCVGES